MVLTHTTADTYAHPFPTVTLAFFLRYCSPQLNPFAQHVLSTDTISSQLDPATGRLHTTRIHLKKSRMPNAVLRLLPASMTGGVVDKASYILETSVVDIREGWMRTESRNLNYTGILSVVEQQVYTADAQLQQQQQEAAGPAAAATAANSASTGVETTVVFRSRLGERIRERIEQGHQRYQQQIQDFKQQRQWYQSSTERPNEREQQQQQQQQQHSHQPLHDRQQEEQDSSAHDAATGAAPAAGGGWFAASGWIGGLGTKGIQRSIEVIASTKTQDQLGKSREGMRMILERLRQTGIIGVLELRRRAMEGQLDAGEKL